MRWVLLIPPVVAAAGCHRLEAERLTAEALRREEAFPSWGDLLLRCRENRRHNSP
jgi:hypothetical protein